MFDFTLVLVGQYLFSFMSDFQQNLCENTEIFCVFVRLLVAKH